MASCANSIRLTAVASSVLSSALTCWSISLDGGYVGLDGGQIGLGGDGIVESPGHGGHDGFGLAGFDAGILKLAGGRQSVENSGGYSVAFRVVPGCSLLYAMASRG